MDLKMEVYTSALELIGELEEYQSVIWEDKAFSAGSFSVEALLTDKTRQLLTEENILWIGGETAGRIEHYSKTAENGAYVTVKGRLLTGILDQRILWGLYDMTGTPPEIMRRLVDDCAVTPTLGNVEARKIPGLVLLDAPVGGNKIHIQKTGGSLLEALEMIGAAYRVAFGVRFNPAFPRMEFWTRWGANRSVNQTTNDPVFYSTELDDVLRSEYSYDSTGWRNVALVAGEGEGKDRKMVVVESEVPEAPDVPTPPGPPEQQKVTIALSIDPEGGGTASGGNTVTSGEQITVTAAPSDGYTFVGWQENGIIVSTDEAYTFTATADRNLTAVFMSMQPKEFDYTGDVVAETLTIGRYKLEVWGAEGGYRSSASYAGKGGYSVGEIDINEPTPIFIRAGGSGSTGKKSGGFNGGGMRGTYNGGGGASDIRIGVDDLNHRVIVAGGGGSDGASSKAGGYGGGEAGQGRTDKYGTGGFGGTQAGVSDASWQAAEHSTNTTTKVGAYGGFGFGGNGISSSSGHGGAGGGGWYGGSGAVPDTSNDDDRGGGGGSGFVWTGQSVPEGYALTTAHCLKNASTIDGSQSITSPAGTAETGHSGNGYVRITPVIPPKRYIITVSSDNSEYGSVSGGGAAYENDQVTVTATPADGCKFVSWNENGAAVSTDAAYTFTVTGNRTLTATFRVLAAYTITASIDPAGGGTVTGAGTYYEGETVTITATKADGYKFTGWQENGAVVSADAEYTFPVTADRALTAVFEVYTSRLPEGYQEVEYIANLPNSSGVYAVTTGMNNVGNTKTNYVTMANRKYVFELMLKPSTEGSGNIILFGSSKICQYRGSTGGGTTGNLTKGTESYYYIDPAATSNNFSVYGLSTFSNRYTISYPTDQKFSLTISTPKTTTSSGAVPIPVIVDGVEYSNTNKPYALTSGIQSGWCLFGYQYYHSSTTSSSCTIGAGTNTPCKRPIYLFSFKVYDTSSGEDVLINDWVPCKNASGKVGLLDLLSETFVANQDAAAPFTAGPDV